MRARHAAALALVAVAAGVGCNRSSGQAARPADGANRPAVAVRVAVLEERLVPRVVEISGSLASPEDSTIAAEVEGKIASISVDLGDRVRRGQLLCRINPDELRLRMEQAEAVRQQTEANLARIEKLAKSEMVAAQQLDDSRAAAAQARAAADLARKKYRDTRVVAPFSGAVARRHISAGEYVRPGQALFHIVGLDPLKLTGEVPERYLPWVKVGSGVRVTVDAYPGEEVEGRIGRMGPAVSPQTRAFTVEARIANDKGALKPGMFARAVLQLGEEKALVAPERGVTAFAGVSKVFVLDGSVVRQRQVTVQGRLAGNQVAITGEGLKAGDRIATSGLGGLADGVEVTPR